MTADDLNRWKQPPPPRPRRRNVLLLRLYDSPIYRDPLAWWTTFVAAVSFIAILDSSQPRASGLPPVLDALLAVVIMSGLFAIVPAALRLQLRRLAWRRREQRQAHRTMSTDEGSTGSTVEATVRIPAPPTVRSAPPQPHAPRALPPHGPPPRPPRPETAPVVPPDRTEPSGAPRDNAARPPAHVATPTSTDDSRTFVAVSSELRNARTLQFPIAVNVRALQVASKATTRYAAALDCAEAVTMTLGMSAAAWLTASRADPAALTELARAYDRSGVTFGTWTTLLKRLARAATAAARDDMPPAVAAFVEDPSGKRLGRLDRLREERNRQAHGQRPRSEIEAERRLIDILPPLATALEDAAALRQMPWIVTESSSYRIQDRSYDVTARTVMSDHPIFEPAIWTFVSPLPDGRVYLVPDGGAPIDLTPFVVFRACETCLTEELFFSAKLPKAGSTVLKSFSNSHEASDPSLDSDVRALRQVSSG